MPSFDFINSHIIALESPLRELIHHYIHLIYYIIEIYTYKHLGDNVSFQYRINIVFFFIHLQTTPTEPI